MMLLRFLALLPLAAAMVFAQADRGNLTGTVTDASGAVVPGAKIAVTQTSTNTKINVASQESGDYNAVNLPVGVYNIRVEKEGFMFYWASQL